MTELSDVALSSNCGKCLFYVLPGRELRGENQPDESFPINDVCDSTGQQSEMPRDSECFSQAAVFVAE